jgi:quercetin dioxygenase-like cupin family protein
MPNGRFEDDRGVICDILANIDGVTEIFTKKGAIRGNHVHEKTIQWTYIVQGRLLVATQHDDKVHTQEYGPGVLIPELPGVPHAWKALEDTTVLVFTRGPRTGENYESDVVRLTEENRLLR